MGMSCSKTWIFSFDEFQYENEGDWQTTFSIRDYYQSEFDDRYIRHFDMVETTAGTLRLFVYLYGNNPRSVIFDLMFDQ